MPSRHSGGSRGGFSSRSSFGSSRPSSHSSSSFTSLMRSASRYKSRSSGSSGSRYSLGPRIIRRTFYNQPRGYFSWGFNSFLRPRPIIYYCLKHNYTYYPESWTNNGQTYHAGYYDEQGNYYATKPFVEKKVGKIYTKCPNCNYVKDYNYMDFDDLENCPNCGTRMLIADENDDIFIDSQESHDESIITKIIRWITYVLLGAAICLLPFGMLRSCSSRKTQETQITQTTTNQQESYANLKILNLKKHGNNYRIVSSSDNPDKVLYKDSQDNFYDSETGLYMWYFKDYDVWQYWYEPISGNFGEYGWMEHYDDGWWIEASANNWIQVPSNYDISKLWYIE